MEIKFTPIIPKVDPFSKFDIGYVAEQALKEFGGVIKDEFESTTDTWKQPVTFTVRYNRGQNSVRIFSNDEIYNYVNDGANPHVIRASNAKTLAYKTGYAAKTMPGRIKASQGGKSGSTMFKKEVMHPGIKARRFDDLIFQKMEQTRKFQQIFGRILGEYIAKRLR